MEVNIWLAFLAGLASFLSPCVLSLVPVYLSYLSGRALSSENEISDRIYQLRLFAHGFSFVLGFSVLFILLGMAASAIGAVTYESKEWLARIGGTLVILFGMHISGILDIPWLNYDLRPQTRLQSSRGYLTSFLMGIFFSAGWSPCIGPVLGTILVMAASSGSIQTGFWMLVVYSAGMAVPFLLSTFMVNSLQAMIRRYKKTAVWIEKAFGYLMILIGIMLFLGIFERLARFPSILNFG